MQAKTANRTRFKSALYGMRFKNSKNQPFNNQRNFKLRSLVDRRHLWRSLNALIRVRHKQLLNLTGVVDPLPHSHDLSIINNVSANMVSGWRKTPVAASQPGARQVPTAGHHWSLAIEGYLGLDC